MRIIHFSDTHFQPGAAISKSQRLVERFIDALKAVQQQKSIDLVIFSGDMIDRGGKGFTSMSDAFMSFKNLIIDKVMSGLNLGHERFVFVCGNHDIVRDRDSQYMEKGLSSDLNDITSLDDFVRNPDSIDNVKRVEDFNVFHHKFYADLPGVEYHETPYQSNLVLNIEGKKVCISMLNSAWRCWDSKNDKGHILFGQAQIIDSKQFLDKADIKIGVSHHDYNWCNPFERPNLPKLMVSNYDMMFCGHTHGSDAEMVCRPEGNTFMFTAPGLLHAKLHELNGDYKNGFMVVDYDKDRLHLSATKYWQSMDESFQIDHNYAENGVWSHDIPAGAIAIMNKQVLNVYDTLFDSLPSLNTHLIGYSTTTHAPKTIESIFVMPTLTYQKQSDNSFDPIKTVSINSIEELLNVEGNIIIHGMKESGKTILLDQIFIEILRNRRNNDAIPVMMDYSTIKSNLLQRIANLWDEQISVAKDILEKKNVVLLIDDIDFYSCSEGDAVTVISDFLKQFPKVRLIATSLNRGGLPFEGAEQSDIPFLSIKIESFKSEHIRQLACKWEGADSETVLIRSRINYIIKAFTTFHIPCTPFSVTLLLWILEKGGECQPSNMALLMDGFITELLKDCNGDFTKEKFNQNNKKRLLANIAYGMFREEQESVLQGRSYNYTYGTFLRQIEEHLEQMELKVFNAKQLSRELLGVGLFVHDEATSQVYFRFRCFMEFFLAVKMQMTEEFFEFVMEENNYLDFANELYYFTGLSRDKVSVVARIFTRLEIVFANMIEAIDHCDSIDNIFIERSLIVALGDKDIKYILPQKHNEEEDNRQNNKALQRNETQVEQGNQHKKRVTSFEVYGKLMLLAMDVLRNTEETEESGFSLKLDDNEKRSKSECFNMVVKYSLYYAVAIYMTGMRLIRENKDESKRSKIEEISTILYLLPVLHEDLLNSHLGTLMLADHIKEMIKEQAANQTSEFQNFVATFMYADLKAKDYMKYIKRFVEKYKRKYIADAIYLKLMRYFYESDNDNLDKELAELMTTVYMKSNNPGHGRQWKKDVLLQKFLKTK